MKNATHSSPDNTQASKATCIFCSNPLDGSDEHIIPDSLNGRLHSKGIICSDCNQHFGEKLDPVLKECFSCSCTCLALAVHKRLWSKMKKAAATGSTNMAI
ncbi:MAG: hypothetical protein EOO10_25255 [Chitinophagaceae bacterium]|nr:MAG: hypothetical protein EOO10_25255 [Chitinophagaceae bacterium]